MRKQEQKRSNSGVWYAFATGFDLTAKHPWLLLLPIALDLFFWLGPRLRFQTIIEQIIAGLPDEAAVLELAAPLGDIAPRTNLFSILSVPLVGVPVLMTGITPEKTPLVSRILDIGSGLEWLALLMVLGLFGLFLTAVYYVSIAAVVGKQRSANDQRSLNGERSLTGRIGSSWLRLIGLSLLFFLIVSIIYIPISLVGAVFFLLNSTLGTLTILLAPLIIMWVVIYLSFAPPGITLNNLPLLRAVKESVQLVQANIAPVLSILLLILLLGALLDWLLILADNGNWLTLFNILIHAFVSTGFVTAFFLYYQDRAAVQVDAGNSLDSSLI